MREADRTTRQRIADYLREESATPSELAAEFAVPADQAIDHVRHVASSLQEDTVVVAPPECQECGFSEFDDPANLPSRCPDCSCERLTEPTFAVETA